MKIESYIVDPKPFLELKSKLWKVFDILRGENITSENYYVVLFILSLYKDKILKGDVLVENNPIKDQIENALHKSESDLEIGYRNIYPSFEPILKALSNKGIASIVEVICNLDHKILSGNFSELFDSILYNLAQSQGRSGGEFIQPLEITQLICGLFELPEGAKVFNPFAGLASFGVNLEKGQDYFGQELNQKSWALGALRIMAYERPGTSRYVCDDSILNWPDDSKKFDLIVSNPPYGFRLGNQYREIEPGIRTAEQFLVERGLHSLTNEGKLIALLPQGFLYRGMHEERLRQFLVDEDILDTIISLPDGLLSNMGIPLIILVINKKKERPGKVRFVKADKYVEARTPREKVLNVYALNSFIHGKKKDDDSLRIVDNAQIMEWEYNLNVPRYFQNEIALTTNERLVKLKDILVYVKGQRGNLPEKGKLVRIRDLKDDKVDFHLKISEVEDVELQRPDIHQINETCLLLAIRWRTLKPTLFDFEGITIYHSQDILSFKVNESVADYGYLINELHADYVQEQLESYRMGATIPFIRRNDLMEVAVKLPTIEEQRAKVQGIYELSDKIKKLQKERNALAHGKTIKQFNEFASLKHTLGRPRQNILDWSDNLLDFLNKKKEGFEALNKAFSEFYDIDIISALKEIKRDVNFITDVLEKGENGLVLSEYDKQVIALSDINSIITELSNNGFNFKIKKLLLKGEKLKERGINANKTLFKTLLDNILTNANKYAFDKKAMGNEVVIELTEVDDSLSMEIRNNGKPFPKNFDREKFITKYSTADSSNGSGLGGYDIHRIASDFNNPDWILSLNEDPFFFVKFKFQFPIKLIN